MDRLIRRLFTFLTLAAALSAQQPFSGAPELEHSLRKLNQLGSLLMIAAHPDDERTDVLAYFARGRHMRTAYLSLTRGEGGQNLIGSEQGAQLGIIRTQELLAARQIDGAEQFFARTIDFGFTRTASETLEKWGRERTLSDIVWVVRRYRPDLIVLVFSGTPADGHGQHQVSAILGTEAFSAAADPKRFPEQLRYVEPWQATRLVRASWFNDKSSTLPAAGTVETGAFNPILGYSYEELAVLSRSMHHSQGTGAMRRPGPGESDFRLVAGKPATGDPFDGIDTSWNRLPGGAPIGVILAEAIHGFDAAHPENAIPLLAKARPLIAAIHDPLAKIKLAELDETMGRCAGLFVEAQAASADAAPGGELAVTTTVLNRSAIKVELTAASMEGLFNQPLEVKPETLAYNQSATIEFRHAVSADAPYSQPYWLVKPPAGDVYTVEDQTLVGLADTPPVAQVRVHLTIAGAEIELVRPVHQRYADRAQGERVRPLSIVPAVALNLPETVAVFPDAAPRPVHLTLQSNVAKAAGQVRLDLPAGWKVEPASLPFEIAAAGAAHDATFEVTPPAGEHTATLHGIATVNGRDIGVGVQVIAYPHFPAQTLFPPSEIKLVRANVKVTRHKIGYIMGAGDEMPDALRQIGLDVTLLGPSDLAEGDLSRFDAIVAGVRAYNVRADVRANQARLLAYVNNGGAYIVQYNTGDTQLDIGPYPMTEPPGNRYRVTVEEAPVAFTHADSSLLQWPNHISPADFDGWVQERGLYFASEWDKRYQTVLSTEDPGEKPLEGGELWTHYGKGVFIFTAYSWFRQLPAGVPGAYRLFANLLSAK